MKLIHTLVFLFAFAAVVYAKPIQFKFTGFGSGTLAGSRFNGPFVIFGLGNTDNRQTRLGGVYVIEHDLATIDVEGRGTFTFVTPTETFVNHTTVAAGISRAMGSDLYDLLSGPDLSALKSWDMLSSTGPHTGTGNIFQWGPPALDHVVMTNAGELLFRYDDNVSMTFTAIVIPEPSSILVAAGLVLIGACRRH